MSFKIENNVPVPAPCGGAKAKYPWAEMKVGDSFFVPNGKQAAMTNCALGWAARRQNGAKFAIRTEGNGVRVWRVK